MRIQTTLPALFSAALFLAACGGPQGTATMPAGTSITVRHNSSTESVLYSFAGGSDGSLPFSDLTPMHGALYGTTYNGGTNGIGTAYSITTSGSEKVVHTFGTGTDGAYPRDLVKAGYGVTTYGGKYNEGTVYHLALSGKEKVIHSFGGGSDGQFPSGALIDVGGTFYGTTWRGGANGYGTVFSITPSGTETTLYSFAGGADGANASSALVAVNNMLYGTTDNGGKHKFGTLFSITTSGTETVLYNFKGGADGAYPDSGLTQVGSALYGVTLEGGSPANLGVVYKFKLTGKETVLHSFGGQPDGALPPPGNLLLINKVLIGTTREGGTNNNGTVYGLSPQGGYGTLYSFGANGSNDGSNPLAELTYFGGVFYGTTSVGGTNNLGTVFAFTP